MASKPLNTVCFLSSAEAIEGLLALTGAGEPILDVAWGSGVFWKGSTREVFGCDIQPERAPHIVCDFTMLPFTDELFPTVVYDPPFHPRVGSAEEIRFSAMGNNEKDLKKEFQAGLRECWRVCDGILIVKCQGFIHNHEPQWMPLWAIEVCGEPFEWLVVGREQKRVSGRWENVRSLRRNHADYLVFCRKGNHR